MLTAVKSNLKYFIKSIKCSISAAFAYKTSFVVQTIFMFINNGFFLLFWAIIINVNGGNANGIVMNDILYLWSVPVIAYGVAHFFFGGIVSLSSKILTGGFDTYLLQPKHPLLSVMTSKCDFSACGDILYGLVIGFFASGGNILQFLGIILLGIMGATIYISTNVLIRLSVVLIGDNEVLANRYEELFLITFATYPEAIYSNSFKIILYTIIPSAYIAFMPIKIIQMFDWKSFIILMSIYIFSIFIMFFVFNKAIRKYESGNSIKMVD